MYKYTTPSGREVTVYRTIEEFRQRKENFGNTEKLVKIRNSKRKYKPAKEIKEI